MSVTAPAVALSAPTGEPGKLLPRAIGGFEEFEGADQL